jgi:hypothetical protein
LHLVKRMIKEFGDAMSLVCSQTLNGCDVRSCLIKLALFEYKVVSGVILVSRRTDAG